MAWDPCVSCGREFHGHTQFNYVTWWIGQEKFAFRLRQCEECSAALRTDVRANGDQRNADGNWGTSPLQPDRRPEPSDQQMRHIAARAIRKQNGHVA